MLQLWIIIATYTGTDCINNNSPDCTVPQSLMGATCAECNIQDAILNPNTYYNYFDSSTRKCYVTNNYEYAPNCDALGAGINRVCACDYNYDSASFNFLYTTPASF